MVKTGAFKAILLGRSAQEANARKRLARIALAVLFLLTAILHFVATDSEEKIIPGFFPYRRELVYFSGILEIIGAIGLLVPPARRIAGYSLAALLIAIFPANINHAVNNIQLGGLLNSPIYQWARLPFQFLLIAWTLWCSSPDGIDN